MKSRAKQSKTLKVVVTALFLGFSNMVVFSQGIQVTPEFKVECFELKDSIYWLNERQVFLNKIPVIPTSSSQEQIKIYCFGKDDGFEYKSPFLAGCFQAVIQDTNQQVIPFAFCNLSYMSELSYLEVFVSQKKRRSWVKHERRLRKNAIADEQNYQGNFKAVRRKWENGEIEIPKSINKNKPFYIYVVVRNPKDIVVVHFGNV